MYKQAIAVGLIGIGCSTSVWGQEEALLSATGTDSLEQTQAQTDADGQVLVESPEFPRGARFILRDAADRPLEGIHLEYQGGREDSVVVGRFADPEGRMRKAIFLGVPSADEATPLTLSQASPNEEIAALLGEEADIFADEETLERVSYPGPGRTMDLPSVAGLIEELLQGEGDRLVLTLGPTGGGAPSLLIEEDKYYSLNDREETLEDYVGRWIPSTGMGEGGQAVFVWVVDWGTFLPGVAAGLQIAGDTALHFTREERQEVHVGLVSTTGDQYTVEAWIRATDKVAGPNTEAGIVGQHASVDDAKGTLDIMDGKLRFLVNTQEEGHHDLRSEMDVPIGVWTHVAAVYDGQSMKLFIDGVERGSTPASGPIVSKNRRATRIGGYAGTAANRPWFDGEIDEVRIWEVARTTEQLRAGMYHEIEAQTGLLGYWRFGDGGGAVASDHSGHGNRGELTNYRGSGRPTWVPGVFSALREAGVAPR